MEAFRTDTFYPQSLRDSPKGHAVSHRSTGAIAASVSERNLADANVAALMRLIILASFRTDTFYPQSLRDSPEGHAVSLSSTGAKSI